jgi:hypothetical protein
LAPGGAKDSAPPKGLARKKTAISETVKDNKKGKPARGEF